MVMGSDSPADGRSGVSDDYEPQFPVVGEDLPWPAAREVVPSPVRAVRLLETADQ